MTIVDYVKASTIT